MDLAQFFTKWIDYISMFNSEVASLCYQALLAVLKESLKNLELASVQIKESKLKDAKMVML